MPSERSVKLAKYGPLLSVVAVVATVLIGVLSAQVLGLSVDGALVDRYGPLLFGAAFLAMGVLWLHQSQFVLRHPEVAIEHDVEPPSKYDLSYETTRGARKVGLLGLAGALFALVLGVGGLVVGL